MKNLITKLLLGVAVVAGATATLAAVEEPEPAQAILSSCEWAIFYGNGPNGTLRSGANTVCHTQDENSDQVRVRITCYNDDTGGLYYAYSTWRYRGQVTGVSCVDNMHVMTAYTRQYRG